MKSQHQIYIDILNLYGCQERQLKKIVASISLALSIVPEPNIMLVLSQLSGYLQRCIGVGCLGFSWKRLHPILTSGFFLETVYSYLSSQVALRFVEDPGL